LRDKLKCRYDYGIPKGETTMLVDHPVHTALPADDPERARRFYAKKLGLTPESEMLGGLFYRCGENSRFLLFPSQGKAPSSLGMTNLHDSSREEENRNEHIAVIPVL
jgi:catechol 2,3-dioxygenase-like lactoylglutathione lyase family enzyme